MLFMTKAEKKIERRNKIIMSNKTSRRTFVPIEQFNFIKANFEVIKKHIFSVYNFDVKTYLYYNAELTYVYDYLQSMPETKYLMTRFFNLIANLMVFDTRINEVNDGIVNLWKQDSIKARYYTDCLKDSIPTVFLKQIPEPWDIGLYHILSKEALNLFIKFLFLINQCADYKTFQINSDKFLTMNRFVVSSIYVNLDHNLDYEQYME